MIRQRRESIEQYERGGRIDLAEREAEEIAVIQTFLPPAIEGDDLVSVVRGVVDDLECQHNQGHGPHDGVPEAKVFGPHGLRQGERAGEGTARFRLICRDHPLRRRQAGRDPP